MKRPISPLITVIVYALCGIAWILITDSILIKLPGHISFDTLWLGQHFKGIFFILLSAILLYGMMKRNMARLASSEKAYRRMFHESPQPMWIISRQDTCFVEVNEAAIRLYGYSRDEFLTMQRSDLFAPGKNDALKSNQDQHLKKDGAIVYIQFESFSTIYDKQPVDVISLQDITDKFIADEALHQQSQLLKTIINSTNHMVWALNSKLEFVTANDAFYKHAPLLPGIEIPSPYWKAVYEKSLHGEKQLFDYERPTDDSYRNYVELALEPIYHKGQIAGVACMAQDITDRKTQELELKKALERYDILALATNDAVWDIDVQQYVVDWNNNAQHLFGINAQREPVYNWWDRIHREDVESISTSVSEAFRTRQQHWSGEYRLRVDNGTYRHVACRGYIIYDKDKPARIIGSLQDIEDRKAQQEEIRKLSLVASMTHSPIIITDPQSHIEWVNKSFEDLYGYVLEDIKGLQPHTFMHGPDTDPGIVREIREKIASSQPCVIETLNYSEDGEPYWVMMDITPVVDAYGKVERLIMIQTNITEFKKIQQQLEDKNKILMEVAYISSHRLRRPVASMLGVLSLLDRENLSNPENQQFLHYMDTLTKDMDSMIHELATKSRIIQQQVKQ